MRALLPVIPNPFDLARDIVPVRRPDPSALPQDDSDICMGRELPTLPAQDDRNIPWPRVAVLPGRGRRAAAISRNNPSKQVRYDESTPVAGRFQPKNPAAQPARLHCTFVGRFRRPDVIVVISTGGRRPEWRNLPANAAFASWPARVPSKTARGHPGGGIGRNRDEQTARRPISPLRCAAVEMMPAYRRALSRSPPTNVKCTCRRGPLQPDNSHPLYRGHRRQPPNVAIVPILHFFP